MVKVVSHGCVVDGVRGPTTRRPPTDGTDGGTEAGGVAHANRRKGPI